MTAAEVHEHSSAQPPRSARASMVRGAVQTGLGLGQMFRQIWLAGLGALATTGEEGAHLFRALVERGEAVEPNLTHGLSRLRHEVTSRMQWPGEEMRSEKSKAAGQGSMISSRFRRAKAPERSEFDHLAHRLDELAARVEEIAGPTA